MQTNSKIGELYNRQYLTNRVRCLNATFTEQNKENRSTKPENFTSASGIVSEIMKFIKFSNVTLFGSTTQENTVTVLQSCQIDFFNTFTSK